MPRTPREVGIAVFEAMTPEDKAHLAIAMYEARYTEEVEGNPDAFCCTLGNNGMSPTCSHESVPGDGGLRAMCIELAEGKATGGQGGNEGIMDEPDWQSIMSYAFRREREAVFMELYSEIVGPWEIDEDEDGNPVQPPEEVYVDPRQGVLPLDD